MYFAVAGATVFVRRNTSKPVDLVRFFLFLFYIFLVLQTVGLIYWHTRATHDRRRGVELVSESDLCVNLGHYSH